MDDITWADNKPQMPLYSTEFANSVLGNVPHGKDAGASCIEQHRSRTTLAQMFWTLACLLSDRTFLVQERSMLAGLADIGSGGPDDSEQADIDLAKLLEQISQNLADDPNSHPQIMESMRAHDHRRPVVSANVFFLPGVPLGFIMKLQSTSLQQVIDEMMSDTRVRANIIWTLFAVLDNQALMERTLEVAHSRPSERGSDVSSIATLRKQLKMACRGATDLGIKEMMSDSEMAAFIEGITLMILAAQMRRSTNPPHEA
jgi:hypothetical protein